MIFPALIGKSYAEVNLNDLAKDWLSVNFRTKPESNPLIDPVICQKMVNEYHTQHALAFSYGGYMEDRSQVWAQSYLQPKNTFLHLAIDYNAPVGTEVAVDQDVEVIMTGDDTPLVGGWGSHVLFKLAHEDMYILYAHLDKTLLCAKGESLKADTVFATVGAPEVNGHWYSHVHVQAITPETYQKFANDFDALDGYGLVSEKASLESQYPNPNRFVSLV